MTLYNVSAEAQNDLFEIWFHIAQDSVDLANRIDREFQAPVWTPREPDVLSIALLAWERRGRQR